MYAPQIQHPIQDSALLFKYQLVVWLMSKIEALELTESQAAERFQTGEATIAILLSGNLEHLATEEVIRMAIAGGLSIKLGERAINE